MPSGLEGTMKLPFLVITLTLAALLAAPPSDPLTVALERAT